MIRKAKPNLKPRLNDQKQKTGHDQRQGIGKAHVHHPQLVNVYSDGSCLGNPGKGGWAFYVLEQNVLASGSHPYTTNNQMEMTGVIRAIEYLIENQVKHAIIYTDSTYVSKGITSWVERWEKNGWITTSKTTVKNIELWKTLRALTTSPLIKIQFKWVKAHSINEYNNKVDVAAREAANKQTITDVPKRKNLKPNSNSNLKLKGIRGKDLIQFM
jgi:ribonuclease HI